MPIAPTPDPPPALLIVCFTTLLTLLHHRRFNILFVTSNHQTTNLVFPNFFHEFFSVLAVEKENKFFIGPKKWVFFQFWTNEKFVFFFNCSNWEKLVEIIGENKIGGLVVWYHERDIHFYEAEFIKVRIFWEGNVKF